MPLYEFRCTGCGPVERSFAMAEVPASIVCSRCNGESRRMVSSPRLSHVSSTAMGLLDSTARSAHEPAAVSGSVPGTRRSPTPMTSNPLHRKLPRP
ncbi:zinc ribbon domain-containing protein [Rhodococcus sp. IEGM 1379]|uniref:zinc ribbon domain-containing protein n=1 Tax=Rhodococcus sp. IEGM 1379 TaxID=3047086 RepID=UPI0024B6A3DD|nr:zinc ribbon domain-containing protein [Rhodococcus sp. IEGM 1379]MDI9917040.1 zinc ribbon domain-containing protein [Rhodococcus sp. IEGM 1379]